MAKGASLYIIAPQLRLTQCRGHRRLKAHFCFTLTYIRSGPAHRVYLSRHCTRTHCVVGTSCSTLIKCIASRFAYTSCFSSLSSILPSTYSFSLSNLLSRSCFQIFPYCSGHLRVDTILLFHTLRGFFAHTSFISLKTSLNTNN